MSAPSAAPSARPSSVSPALPAGHGTLPRDEGPLPHDHGPLLHDDHRVLGLPRPDPRDEVEQVIDLPVDPLVVLGGLRHQEDRVISSVRGSGPGQPAKAPSRTSPGSEQAAPPSLGSGPKARGFKSQPTDSHMLAIRGGGTATASTKDGAACRQATIINSTKSLN